MGQVQRLFEPLAEWQMQRLPQHSEGYTLDLDSTVFERYGKQEGRSKGTTRASTDGPAIILCWPCSVKPTSSSTAGCAAATAEPAARGGVSQRSSGVVGQRQKIRLLRADSGFFDDRLLSFLEQRRLPYIVVARLTLWVKRAAQRVGSGPCWMTISPWVSFA